MAKKINISKKELDRDIRNMNLPEMDLASNKELDFYGEEMKDWLNSNDNTENKDSAKK